jgi:hypothetical protein
MTNGKRGCDSPLAVDISLRGEVRVASADTAPPLCVHQGGRVGESDSRV